MATTLRQDQDFLAHVIPSALLESAIEWIAKNMSPDDVFSERALEEWAEANGFVVKE